MRKKILYGEIGGFTFIFFIGALWHFLYDWSSGNTLLGLIAPVNDSVWEHFKIGVYPALLFALLDYPIIGKDLRQYWPVRALGLYLIPLFIALLFYGYTAFLGYNLLALDILIFALAVAVTQFISYKLLVKPQNTVRWQLVSILAIMALLIAFALLTLHPLPLPMFVE